MELAKNKIIKDVNIKTILLDVRGTILDKKEDFPLSKELKETITSLLLKNKRIIFITACSITTLTNLVLKELTNENNSIQKHLPNIISYINNSSGAYTYDSLGTIVRLKNYSFVKFSNSDIKILKKIIGQINKQFKLQNVWVKEKAGQFNYYCGGSFEERTKIAEALRVQLKKVGKEYINILVPTSKDTIDISINNKSRGVSDCISRFGIKQKDILFVSDSLQEHGADRCICLDFPKITSVHVKNATQTVKILNSIAI